MARLGIHWNVDVSHFNVLGKFSNKPMDRIVLGENDEVAKSTIKISTLIARKSLFSSHLLFIVVDAYDTKLHQFNTIIIIHTVGNLETNKITADVSSWIPAVNSERISHVPCFYGRAIVFHTSVSDTSVILYVDLVLIHQQSVKKRSLHLIDTVNANNRWTTIY
jgi:hypothetical protein